MDFFSIWEEIYPNDKLPKRVASKNKKKINKKLESDNYMNYFKSLMPDFE